MNKEEFSKSLKDFLEQKTYIVAYRSNYDSARQFNNELIKYIQSLQQKLNQLETNWNELKEWLQVCLEENNKVRLYDNNSYQAGEINTLENVIDEMQELERGCSNG